MADEIKYKFSNEEDFDEVYKIASLQFRKIIKNFNQYSFRSNFEDLFYGGDDCKKLFLKENNSIICGALTWTLEDTAFCDIFFWNGISHTQNKKKFRFFSERLFIYTQKKGINNIIIPLDKSRFKYEFFKKYCQKVFFSEEELVLSDKSLIDQYKNHYLLKINYENYFKKAEEANVRILYE